MRCCLMVGLRAAGVVGGGLSWRWAGHAAGLAAGDLEVGE